MKKTYSLPVIVLLAIASAYFNLDENTKPIVNPDVITQESPLIETYADARRVFWQQIYNNGGETLYCGVTFGSGYHADINIEHVYPMSWVGKHLRCGDRSQCRRNNQQFNRIEADMHNLYPSLKDINRARSSFAFAIIPGEKRFIQECDFEVDEQKRKIEPRDEVLGNIARSMLYMEQQYELEIFQKQRQLLLQWHQQDPVDEAERKRHQLIQSLQGNTNPFIQ